MAARKPAAGVETGTTFGDLLRRHRLAAGLTQEGLAEQAGLSTRAISDLERGVKRHPQRETLRRLAEALALPPPARAALATGARRPPSSSGRRPAGSATATGSRSLMPVPSSALVGREPEVAEVAALLRRPDVRLLTLTGPGGVGKTRLALAVGAALAEDYPDGVAFVDLTSVGEPVLVPGAVAATLGVADAGGRPLVDRLATILGDRPRLLVLDNFEQVLGAAPFVADLLARCAGITVLVTSRARLRVGGEREVVVPPLRPPEWSAPAAAGALSENAAVRLFAERTRAVDPGFALTDENAAAVAEICRRLDGLPLALELAAARGKVLPPAALLARLERRLPLLVGGSRDAPARQRTLRDAIAWSHDLLSPEEQILFRRLAVFVGGWTLEAAEAVCGSRARGDTAVEGRGPTDSAVLDGVAALVDGSLVQREAGSDRGRDAGEPRFAMLETVREFALERLAASGDAAALRDGHAAWYLDLAERADPHLLMPGQEPWLARLEAEGPNLRAAEQWLHAAGAPEHALRLAGALRWFWLVRGDIREGTGRLEQALSAAGDGAPAARARALTGLGFLAAVGGRARRADEALTEGLALARLAEDPWETGWALHGLGLAAGNRGDYERAEAHYGAARSTFTRLAEVLPTARARVVAVLTDLGWVAFGRGDLALAADRLEEALAGERALGFTWLAGLITINLGNVAWFRGDHGRAAAHYRDALAVGAAHHDRRLVAYALEGLAALAAERDEAERAGRLVGAAAALRDAIGVPLPSHRGAIAERTEAAVRAGRAEAGFRAARDEGRALPPERAIAEAFALADALVGGDAPPRPPQYPTAGLSPREREVLRLIAAGRSNAEIAATLFISPRTATTHATNILNKLGLSSRAEVIAFAHREGLA